VLWTTARLWPKRWMRSLWPPERRWRIVIVAALAAVVLAAGAVAVGLRGSGPGQQASSRTHGGTATGAIAAAAAARQQAAAWIASQANANAVVACDPAMCAVLLAHKVPASLLLRLSPDQADPLGSDIVVATPAVRSQFGTRLTGVYAPVTLATFGSGALRIDVRAAAADGAPAYRAQLATDVRARHAAAAALLQNEDLHVTGAARTELADGKVDSRLLVTLAALSHLHPVDIFSFGGSGPGASAGVPLRSVEISGATPAGGGHPASLASLLAFFRAQRTPYLPASMKPARMASGRGVLRIEYGVPCPLGLLGSGS
jgi:hypothetical protein